MPPACCREGEAVTLRQLADRGAGLLRQIASVATVVELLIDLDSDTSFADFPPQMTLQQCGSSAAARRIQNWAFPQAPQGAQLSLAQPPPYLFPGTCMDGGGIFLNVSVYPWLCRNASDPVHSNQLWLLDGTRLRSMAVGPKYPQPVAEGLCLSAGRPGEDPKLEVGLVLEPCDLADDARQAFSYTPGDGTLRHMPSGLCVDAGVIGRTMTWTGSTWTTKRIVPHACPDNGNPALLPRDRVGSYTVGHTSINGDPKLGDLLLVIGGDDTSNNVYYSSDCGINWYCFDGEEPWTPFGVSYAPLLTLDALPGSPLIMAGGFDNQPDGTMALSSALYYTFDGGADTWERAYDLPFAGVFPGLLAQDRSSVYLFGGADTGFAVWSIDETTYNTSGFALIPGSANAQGADVGRRVYVRGSVSGGCFFATDYNPADLWVPGIRTGAPISSSNAYSVARVATGPWTAYTAPWAPRASAAVALSRDGTRVYVAGGVGFAGGAPTGEALTDAWAVDANVCLLGTGGALCSGHGIADVTTVTCGCEPAWQGDDRCSSCTLGNYGPTCSSTCPSGNGFCNAGAGWGACDPQSGCVCNGQHVNGPAAACDACAPAYWGSSCAACPACDPVHTVGGACDGSGTTGGSGRCVCLPDYEGPTCSQAIPAFLPSSTPNPPAPAPAPATLPAGAAAAVALLVISLSAAGGLFVYGRYMGGAPRLAAAWQAVSASAAHAAAKVSGGGVERTSLLSGTRVTGATAAAASARFARTPPKSVGK